MTTESTSARILRELTARKMTRRELAELTGLSAGAISIQVAKLQALRVIAVAGNVRTPSGLGVVPAFRATPDGSAIFEAHASAPPQPHRTPARLELLALLARSPASVARVAHLTGRSERNTRKGLTHMEEHGLVERQSVQGLASVQFHPTPAGRAMLGGP
jgi:predicted transcriptional regulator